MLCNKPHFSAVDSEGEELADRSATISDMLPEEIMRRTLPHTETTFGEELASSITHGIGAAWRSWR